MHFLPLHVTAPHRRTVPAVAAAGSPGAWHSDLLRAAVLPPLSLGRAPRLLWRGRERPSAFLTRPGAPVVLGLRALRPPLPAWRASQCFKLSRLKDCGRGRKSSFGVGYMELLACSLGGGQGRQTSWLGVTSSRQATQRLQVVGGSEQSIRHITVFMHGTRKTEKNTMAADRPMTAVSIAAPVEWDPLL